MPDASSFTLHTAVSSAGAVITVGGELDFINAPALQCAVARLCETPPPSLVLDMAGVEFIDVAAARVIVTAAQAWPGPDPIVIRDPSPIVRRLLQVTGWAAAVRLEEAGPAAPGQLTQIITPAGGDR